MSEKKIQSWLQEKWLFLRAISINIPQTSGYEDSLAAECLIRAFLDEGGMEDPILKVLFIGGSKLKQGETEYELAFKRLKSCWLERKERSYGMRESQE